MMAMIFFSDENNFNRVVLSELIVSIELFLGKKKSNIVCQ
jgi:hypothetical protein